ncbi:RAMP superfamily CRISPR-associated protein [Roseomonas sp. AR75]|uniref:RAMP superfamily CRISPR-associated protein n=1 Tax=Roseomonas sp. AR75 TaxID=2562311 RepID=UPI001485C0FB|nr:RAMP superfamily CRISPR-associated protein [Roseomonas sp. AR75]
MEVVSPLHIGAGFDEDPALDDADPHVAQIVLGCDDLPVITATGLKGALRALLPPDEASDLFGSILDDPDKPGAKARAGVLTPYAAMLVQPAVLGARAEPAGFRNDTRGTYRAVRTAIDAATGVPASYQLSNAEMVAPGARFRFRMRLAGPPNTAPEREARVARLLASMQAPGLRLGRGRGDGQGVVRLVAIDVVATRWLVGQTIERGDDVVAWRDRVRTATRIEPAGTAYVLTLSGTAPFLVMASPDGSQADNTLHALRSGSGSPELPGSSLMGALRSRAAWLAGLRRLRAEPGHDEDELVLAELFGLRADQQRNKGFVARIAARCGRHLPEVTGFAGLLVVDSIEAGTAPLTSLPSVRIDRFTQAPMDGALFNTEAFLNPTFRVDLRLRPHPGGSQCEAPLHAWVRRLIADMTDAGPRQGLMLGHGGNRGFGWFEVGSTP